MIDETDSRYLAIILNRIEVCKSYKPKFGQGTGQGLSREAFTTLYSSDAFYTWFGLDHPLMYAAHKAAGGITSIYRQIGIGCEQIFRQILIDQFSLSLAQVTWSYSVQTSGGNPRSLSLDARLSLHDVHDEVRRGVVAEWLKSAAHYLNVAPEISGVLNGAVFEVRQGYKSKDSKRQNADIANAASAYSSGYLPVVVLLSTQIDSDIVTRYRIQRWLILRGFSGGSPLSSTYAFMRDIVGYDLGGFFERHSTTLKRAVIEVLNTLLSADE